MSLKGKNGADAGREYADKFQAYIENGKSTGNSSLVFQWQIETVAKWLRT